MARTHPAKRRGLALEDVLAIASRGARELWIFGYASLIWRPDFEPAERRMARVHGWHRAFRMRSRVNRGTTERPGLVFALMAGGSCQGVVFRLQPERAVTDLRALWEREMPIGGVYEPRWLPCRTAGGLVQGLAFTLPHHSDSHLGRLPETVLLDILRHARGRYGSTLDYLLQTATSLRAHGVRDRDIERLVGLARQHGLL